MDREPGTPVPQPPTEGNCSSHCLAPVLQNGLNLGPQASLEYVESPRPHPAPCPSWNLVWARGSGKSPPLARWPWDTKSQHWPPSDTWNTWTLHHPDSSPRPLTPAHRLCLLGEPLGDPLVGEPLGDPFPWEPLLSPLNMVEKQVPAQAGLRQEEGRQAVCVLDGYSAGLWRGGTASRTEMADSGGPSLQVRRQAWPALRMPQCPPAPAQPVWEERAQPRGGAPGRLPQRFGLVTPTRPGRSHPRGKWPGAAETDRCTHTGAGSAERPRPWNSG
jgi:hypothetical protein